LSRRLSTLSIVTLLLLGGGLFATHAAAVPQIPTLGIRASIVPTKLPADGGIYQAVFVQLAAPGGSIVAAPQDYQLIVTSSNQDVGVAQSPLVIAAGQTFGSSAFATSLRPGATAITISGNGLSPAVLQLTTYSTTNMPSKLAVSVAPQTLVSDGNSAYYLFVQLQDVSGTPSRTSTPLTVLTTTSAPGVVSVQPSVTIPAGGTYVSTQLMAGSNEGNATITAQLNGFQSTAAAVMGIHLPLNLTLTSSAAGTVFSGSSVLFSVTATSTGVPVRGGDVTWSVSPKGGGFTNGSLTTDASGTASASLLVVEGGNVTVSALVSARGNGTKSISTTIRVKALSLDVRLIPSSLAVNASQPSDVSALVASGGRPVVGAQVAWSSSLGTFSPSSSSTDPGGIAKSTFVSSSTGNATITATATAAGYTAATGTVAISVGAPGGAGGGSGGPLAFIPGPAVFGFPILLLGLVAAAVLIVTLVLIRRRRASAREPRRRRE
jgi:hypothetical protein